ncbi:isoprenylcysteine carboxyl methyltransferase family protein [Sandaracinus amylolyticus]|uniref:isoprenylcysteine carboxyl methyltransferase family protein n=1 Tax=Sandaracinus amylolyticus TaxID=927083 RepID=UPI001F32C37F|nr:isoprenylcysteine carboxylmethyltransferase family protein [Sandaracinus amylolyticus]UJR81170.1 Isoprenylcysteine carboxyl methyltransferase [Sandaracinus amylolyticus]
MGSRVAFTILVALVAMQRLWEVRRSARHEAALRAAGGREHAPEQMPWMRAIHAGWLVAMIVEVWALHRVAPAWLAVSAFVVFLVGQGLRLAAMRALGPRWTVKVITVPGEVAISRGVLAHVRHPNYLGVVLEIAALPLVHGAWLTSIVFSIANAVLLRARIRAEEAALRADASYEHVHRDRPRFIPGVHA